MSKRILVVEDKEDNRRILRDLLTSADYEIMEAENGQEALTAAAKQRADLILMDIHLPIMDGYEATRRIKANPTLTHVPVIAVTSFALSGDKAKARAAGCDDFVPKPYSPRQLLRRYGNSCPNAVFMSRRCDAQSESARGQKRSTAPQMRSWNAIVESPFEHTGNRCNFF
jgi:two-component system cell cycle response regulator DivK